VTGVSEATKKQSWAEAQPSKGGDGRAKKGKKKNSEESLEEERILGKGRKPKEGKGGKGRRGRSEEGEGEGEGDGEGEVEGEGEMKRKGKGRKGRRKEKERKRMERVVGAMDPLKYCEGTARRRSQVRYCLEGPQRRRFPRRRDIW
jgi:hypothetical protein